MCLPFCCDRNDPTSAQGTHNQTGQGESGGQQIEAIVRPSTGNEENNGNGAPAGVAPGANGNMNKQSGEDVNMVDSPARASPSPEIWDRKRAEKKVTEAPVVAKSPEHVVASPSHLACSPRAADSARTPPDTQIAHRCRDVASTTTLDRGHGDDRSKDGRRSQASSWQKQGTAVMR